MSWNRTPIYDGWDRRVLDQPQRRRRSFLLLFVILSAAKNPRILLLPLPLLLPCFCTCTCLCTHLHPDKRVVISTEAAHSLIVSSAVEKSASLPKPSPSHREPAVASSTRPGGKAIDARLTQRLQYGGKPPRRASDQRQPDLTDFPETRDGFA